jgi:hypothetical protein
MPYLDRSIEVQILYDGYSYEYAIRIEIQVQVESW